jgi:hypothetical protein
MTRIDTDRVRTVADLRAAIEGLSGDTELSFGRTPKKDRTGPCWCGCGQTTKSRFVPGHDARFHGQAKRVARGQEAMPETFVCDEAQADFLAHVEAERPVWAARQQAEEQVRLERQRAREAREEARAARASRTEVEVVEMDEIDEETAALLAQM